jgi:hypothetical protein
MWEFAKTAGEKRQSYFAVYLGVGADKTHGEVTATAVSAYLAGRRERITTHNNILDYIKTFMRWCAAPERGYVRASPVEGMRHLANPYEEPRFMGTSARGRPVR